MHASTEEVEQELMELWSAVNKERTALEERRNARKHGRRARLAPIAEEAAPPPSGGADDGRWARLANTDDLDDEASALRPAGEPDSAAGDRGPSAVGSIPQPRATSFLKTFYHMLLDMRLVLEGPERGALLMALCLAFFNQAVASTALINYSPVLLSALGAHKPTLLSAAVSGAKLLGVVSGLMLVDGLGRRPLLLMGSALCTLSLAGLACADAVGTWWLVLIGMCCFIFSFR